MSIARYIPLSILLGVGLLAVSSVTVPVDLSTHHFEAGDFAALRARYTELQNMPGSARVDLLRTATRICSEAPLTPLMIEKMQRFSRSIIESDQETAEARTAAKTLSQVLLNRKMEVWESSRKPARQNR